MHYFAVTVSIILFLVCTGGLLVVNVKDEHFAVDGDVGVDATCPTTYKSKINQKDERKRASPYKRGLYTSGPKSTFRPH